MQPRKASALVAIVGSTSLALVVGCGQSAHEATSQRSSGEVDGQPIAEATESVPMPDWLRGTSDNAPAETALRMPPVARSRRSGDDLGEPPLPQSLVGAGDTPNSAVTPSSEADRAEPTGIRSASHAQLVRLLSPETNLAGTATPREQLAAEATPQPAIEQETIAAADDVNTLSIIGTTNVAATPVDSTAPEVNTELPATPAQDIAVSEAEPVRPTHDVEPISEPIAELATSTPPAAEFAPVQEPVEVAAAPSDVPRLRADLQPSVHPLAAAGAQNVSPHAMDSAAAAEALFGADAGHTAPAVIAIRDIPATTQVAVVKPVGAKPVSAKPVIASPAIGGPVAQQPVAQQPVETEPIETKPIESGLVESKPVETSPIKSGPFENMSIAEAPYIQQAPTDTPAAEPLLARHQPEKQPQAEPAPKQPAAAMRVAEAVQEKSLPTPAIAQRSTPKHFTAPVVTPHGSVTTPVARAVRVHEAPAANVAVANARVAPTQPPMRTKISRPKISREMLAVRKTADQHTFAGFDYAARRALYTAESEFISALRVLTRAADRQSGSKVHAEALADGILALEESDDFLATGSELEADFDVSMIVAGHRTQVLRDAEGLAEMTPLEAAQRYYAFAQRRLTEAVAGEPSGSFALYGLGKLHMVLATEPGANPEAHEPKAVVFHQAALSTSPANYMAANELAVLLARYGKLEEARGLLLHSIAIAPQASTWHNLAVVHAQLGEQQLAMAAEAEQNYAQQHPKASPNDATVSPVRFVEPSEFAKTSDQARSSSASSSMAPTTVDSQASKTKESTIQKTAATQEKSGGLFDLLKRK